MSNNDLDAIIGKEIIKVVEIHDYFSKVPSLVTKEHNCLLAMTSMVIEDLGDFDSWYLYKLTLSGGDVEYKLSPFDLRDTSHVTNLKGIVVKVFTVSLCTPESVFLNNYPAKVGEAYLELAKDIVKTYLENNKKDI